MDDPIPAKIRHAGELFRKSRNILFITGAGISADSGLPTYRGVGGLYDDRETEDGIRIEQALSAEMLRQRPEITWKYLMQIGAAVARHTFNDAHRVIAGMEQGDRRVWVLTQNIDGYHSRAGSRNVIEVHGSMWRLRCEKCGEVRKLATVTLSGPIPQCDGCRVPMRPDVVLFNEPLPVAALQTLDRELGRGFDLIVTVGTSNQFAYILQPVIHAVRVGIPTLEINPARTEISGKVDLYLPLGAKNAMLAIENELGP